MTERKKIDQWVDYKRKGIVTSKLFVDSGAYSAYTRGMTANVQSYVDYVNARSDQITICAQMDTIPGEFGRPRTREDVLKASPKTWDNFLFMRDNIDEPDKCIPIFHQGEDFKWLQKMLDYIDPYTGNHIPYIGISSDKRMCTKDREAFYRRCWEVIHASDNPEPMTHCFGTTAVASMQKFPFYSCDSTSWLRMATNGSIILPDNNSYLVSNVSKGKKDHIDSDPLLREAVKEVVEGYGFNFDLMQQSEGVFTEATIERLRFNAFSFIKQAEAYEYMGPDTFVKRGLF